MVARNIGRVLLLALIEVLLLTVLVFLAIFGTSYIQSNFFLFTDFSVLQYSNGWDSFWMAIYLGCNALFMILVILVVVEVMLFLLRTMIRSGLSTFQKLSGKDTEKGHEFIKQFSLITLLKAMKINSPKRAMIMYAAVILVIFGFKFVAKQVMKGSDAFVYRVYENVHLTTESDTFDFTAEIAVGDEYTLIVDTSVGNIHLYQMKNETTANVIFLYDTLQQLNDYSLVIDDTLNTITVIFNQSVTEYVEYVDTLLPQVELYLPEGLVLSNVEITVGTAGEVVIDFAGMDTLSLDLTNTVLSISAINQVIDHLNIQANSSKLRVQTKSLTEAQLILDDCEASFTLGDVYTSLTLEATNQSFVQIFSLSVGILDILSLDSELELREVYATTITSEITNTIYSHLNGSLTRQPDSYDIIESNSTITLRGVESDS